MFLHRLLLSLTRVAFMSSSATQPRVAVLLSGCGVFDGTELTEVTGMLVQLSRKQANAVLFAPNIDQAQVVNHLNGEPMPESRNVLVEAARIGRGAVKPLVDLYAAEFDALLVPGGFGCAKNLSNFAFEGENMSVNEQVARVIGDFHRAHKPIGLCCIAPILVAEILDGVRITLGKSAPDESWPHSAAIKAAESMGAHCVQMDVNEVCEDTQHRIFTTAAFMKNTDQPHMVLDGVTRLVDRVLEKCSKSRMK